MSLFDEGLTEFRAVVDGFQVKAEADLAALTRDLAAAVAAGGDKDAEIATLNGKIAELRARIAELEKAPDPEPVPDPEPEPDPEPDPEPSVARFGTHWPARTPRPSANDPVVDCTWAAIGAKVRELPPGSAIAVKPGTLVGAGSGSTKPGDLSSIDKGLGARTLIYPRDGYGTVKVITAGASFVGCRGLAFVGFAALGLSVLFRNSWNCAWAWSEIDHRRVTANAGLTAGDIEWVECVSRGTLIKSDDRHRFVTAGSAAATITDVYTIGGYDASIYKPIGSSAHCDSTQVERQTGGGEIRGIHFKDTITFGAHSQTLMFAGIPGVTLDNSLFIGGLANERRYPRDLTQTIKHVYVPRVLAGEAQCELRGRNLITGPVSSGWTYSTSPEPGVDELVRFEYLVPGTETPDPVKMDELYAMLDRDHPEPSDGELASAWQIRKP